MAFADLTRSASAGFQAGSNMPQVNPLGQFIKGMLAQQQDQQKFNRDIAKLGIAATFKQNNKEPKTRDILRVFGQIPENQQGDAAEVLGSEFPDIRGKIEGEYEQLHFDRARERAPTYFESLYSPTPGGKGNIGAFFRGDVNKGKRESTLAVLDLLGTPKEFESFKKAHQKKSVQEESEARGVDWQALINYFSTR